MISAHALPTSPEYHSKYFTGNIQKVGSENSKWQVLQPRDTDENFSPNAMRRGQAGGKCGLKVLHASAPNVADVLVNKENTGVPIPSVDHHKPRSLSEVSVTSILQELCMKDIEIRSSATQDSCCADFIDTGDADTAGSYENQTTDAFVLDLLLLNYLRPIVSGTATMEEEVRAVPSSDSSHSDWDFEVYADPDPVGTENN
jgi:hypothetical protein